MKVGILRFRRRGKDFNCGFKKHNYNVMIGTEHKEKLSEWKEKNNAEIGSFSEAAEFAEIIVLAVKGNAAKEVLKMAGEENLAGKTVIDTTNPIADAPPVNGVLKFFTSLENSLMEQLQKDFPEANFVKAFNSIGNVFMVNPDFNGEKPTMFICGNNLDAKKDVTEILELFGFEVEDMGKVETARAIEPLCILWCIPGFLRNEWSHGFRLLKK